MLRITCPNCQSSLNAKEKLIGQTRNCPKCQHPVLIEAPDSGSADPVEKTASLTTEGMDDETPTIHVEPRDEGEGLAQVTAIADAVTELKSPNKYVICDRQRIIAVWEGDGWQLKTPTGLISAKRNTEQIPALGVFRLVELRVTRTSDAIYLTGIVCHELAARWALPAIARGDNQILEKIVGPSGLTRDQKQLVRRYLQETFMPDVWRHNDAIGEYLASPDQHTQGVVADTADNPPG
jgi:DNA-directed RNA polymerase subunit M/transcription elongation factor TFIIS